MSRRHFQSSPTKSTGLEGALEIDGEQGDSQWGVWERRGAEGLSKEEKGLMDMDNSVVLAVGRGCKGAKW